MQMNNPWLDIPAGDYVGHMSSPEVAQYQVLNRLLRDTLRNIRPRSMLVLGCSMGNGFEHVDPGVTSRVVGVDINPVYLQRLVEQFPHPAFALDVRCADLTAYTFEPEAFELVHAALVFEYVEWSLLLPRVVGTVQSGGVLSVVLQLPSRASPAVTPTRFTSLRALESVFRFVEPDVLVADATALGLHLESRRPERLESAKTFEVLSFRKGAI
jgi:SAM-dependent methyltransferase